MAKTPRKTTAAKKPAAARKPAAKRKPAASKAKTTGGLKTPIYKASKAELLEFYEQMLLIRRFEEKAGQLYGLGLIGGSMFRNALNLTAYQLEPGDIIFQYTDGLSEIQEPEHNEEYTDLRVIGTMVGLSEHSTQDIVDLSAHYACDFAGEKGADDDLTIMAIRFHGEDSEGEE